MSRILTLSRDHTVGTKKYFAGQTITLSDEDYNYVVHAGLEIRYAAITPVEEAEIVELKDTISKI